MPIYLGADCSLVCLEAMVMLVLISLSAFGTYVKFFCLWDLREPFLSSCTNKCCFRRSYRCTGGNKGLSEGVLQFKKKMWDKGLVYFIGYTIHLVN